MVFYLLQRSHIFIKEILKLRFREHRVNNTVNGVFVFFFEFVNRIKEKRIRYDANGNQEEIIETIGEEEISLRKNLWDEENRLKAVDLNPSAGQSMHPIANYTYDASGERTIKYHTEGFDVSSNANNVSDNSATNAMRIMLYPSGLITAKANLDGEGKLSYTKHF